MANTLADRTHCVHGHEFTPDNTSFRKDGGRACKACKKISTQKRLLDPDKVARKRESDRLSALKRREELGEEYREKERERWRRRNQNGHASMVRREKIKAANAEYQRRSYAVSHGKKYAELPVTVVEDELTKKNPLDYLKLNDDQAKRSDTLNFAVDRAKSRPKCEADPDAWAFDPDIPPSSWPTSAEAKVMCEDCPFAKECLAFGESLRAKDVSGIWGGSTLCPREEVELTDFQYWQRLTVESGGVLCVECFEVYPRGLMYKDENGDVWDQCSDCHLKELQMIGGNKNVPVGDV